MKVRYICDSCRMPIADFDHPDLTAERLGLTELTAEEWSQFVYQTSDAVVLYTLCDECAAFLEAADLPVTPPLPQ